jgi:hypothetical protein
VSAFPASGTSDIPTICARDLQRITRVNRLTLRNTSRGVTYVAFSDEAKAIAFERYLKTASGRAFAKKRLR